MLMKKCKGKSFKKISYKKINPCENLLTQFYFSIKNKFYKNDIHFTYKVMKVLFKIENELRNELNATDQLSLDLTVLTGLRRIENIYLQQLDGILSDKAFERIGLEFYRAQYARQSWEKYKTNFDSAFIDFFEKLRDSK